MGELKITVIQWWQNGDHPADESVSTMGGVRIGNPSGRALTEGKIVRRWRRPDVDGTLKHGQCGYPMSHHGWIDQGPSGRTVCPGDLVATIGDQHLPIRIAGSFRPEPVTDPAAALAEWLKWAVHSAAGPFR